MAAELAAELVDGEKCAVCGSVSHPEPARAGEASVTKDDEDAARSAEQKAAADLEAEVRRATELERAVDLLVQRAGDGDVETLEQAHASASAALDQARAAAADVAPLTSSLEELRSRGAQLEEQARAVGNERAVLDTRIEAADEQVRRMRDRMMAAAGADGSVPARRARFDTLATRAVELLDARDRAATLDATARELSERAHAVAAEAGFGSLTEALAAVRPAARIAEIDAVLTAARDRIAGARAVLSDPDIEAIAGVEPVDPSGAEAAAREAATAVEGAAATLAEAENRRNNIERLAGQLEETMKRLGPVLAEHDELAGLADVVEGRGQNARKMSLRSYVLASRLEEVAVSASVRLRRMSAGRYEFVHSDEAGARGRRGGLGLDIRDDYTGVVRSAKTLSGGESFLASLALALGLADVVAAESGGVVLDTMFIDEGFGTLDADTLDLVMGVLDELRAGGRVVGIVSHVDEMRQRIPSRLHVVRGRTGSTLEMIAG